MIVSEDFLNNFVCEIKLSLMVNKMNGYILYLFVDYKKNCGIFIEYVYIYRKINLSLVLL